MSEPVNIDLDLVRSLLRAQFPQFADLPLQKVEPGGWDNRTFRLGDQLSVRLPSAKHYVAQVDKEHRWLWWLAPQLLLPIPTPVAKGEPSEHYPYPWSIYRWIDGDPADVAAIDSPVEIAVMLAKFLRSLHRVAPTKAPLPGAPQPGAHNFWRGAHVSVYEGEALTAIKTLGHELEVAKGTVADAMAVWHAAAEHPSRRPPVWVHGDVAAGNLLVRNGELAAVIDFGCCAVGDPACDLTIAWTFFEGAARDAFRETIALDELTWARARGWALWKAAMALSKPSQYPLHAQANARKVIPAVLAEHRRAFP